MGRRRENAPYATAFGNALAAQLASRGMRQTELAAALGVTRAYVSRTMSGTSILLPARVDNIASAINATPEGRVKLHRAAALDAGYVLDLTPDPPAESG